MRKPVECSVVAILFATFLFSVSFIAEDTSAQSGIDGDLTWTFDDGVLTISGYGSMDKTVTYGPYVGLGVKSIVIGEGVSYINLDYFSNLTKCTDITVAGNNSNYASIDGVLFDKSTKTLLLYPQKRADTSYSIPYGVTTVTEWSISNSNLETLSFPSTLTNYNYCGIGHNLKKFIVDSDNPRYKADNGNLLSKDGNILYQWAEASTTGTAHITNVKTIANYAFKGNFNLTSVVMSDQVTTIGVGAFDSCFNLTSVDLSTNVTSIEDNAFGNDFELSSITLPNGLKTIGAGAFYGSAVTEWTIPNSVTLIGSGAFRYNPELKSITIGSGVTDIERDTFKDCMEVIFVHIGSNVSYIGPNAFHGMNFYESNGSTLLSHTAKDLAGRTFTGTASKLISEATYNVTYLLNGGFGTVPVSKNYPDNTSFQIPSSNISKKDSTFGGWSDGKNTYQPGATYRIKGSDVNFTAVWIVNTCTITINASSGGTVSGAGIYVIGDQYTIKAIADEGFQFVEWIDGSKDSIRTMTANVDMTYTAVFTEIEVPSADDSNYMLIIVAGLVVVLIAVIAVVKLHK